MRFIALASMLILSACGVADVGTTAAVNAKLQAEQAKQGKELMDKTLADVEAAQKAEQQRVATGATQAQQ